MVMLHRGGELRGCKGRKTISVDGHQVGTGRNLCKIKFAVCLGHHRKQLRPVSMDQADVCAGNGGSAYVQHFACNAGRPLRRGGLRSRILRGCLGETCIREGGPNSLAPGSLLLSESARRNDTEQEGRACENSETRKPSEPISDLHCHCLP